MSSFLPLNAKLEVRAGTRSPFNCENAIIRSSVRPSLRYSFSGSELMLRKGNTVLDLVEDLLGNTNAARSGQWFDASSDVDAIANHVVITTDNIARVNSDTNLKYLLRWLGGISLCDHLLNFNPALHCPQNAGKFSQETISNCLDFRAVVFWKN